MGFRSAVVENPARLSLAINQLCLATAAGDSAVPIEDLTALVLDNPQLTLTGALLAKLGQDGCAVVVCDAKHTPCGVFLPFHQYFQQAKVAADQAGLGQVAKKRLWQALVRQKIYNQACVLKFHGCQGAPRLFELALQVKSGDSGNLEAQAAQLYFPKLFGSEFFRQTHYDKDVSRLNGALNYGYAILRSLAAKALVARGFLPALGLKHCGLYNAFNLVDDFIEPFRPLCDHMVFELAKTWTTDEANLSRSDRHQLVLVGHQKIIFQGEIIATHQAMEKTASSLAKAMAQNEAGLLDLPEIMLEVS